MSAPDPTTVTAFDPASLAPLGASLAALLAAVWKGWTDRQKSALERRELQAKIESLESSAETDRDRARDDFSAQVLEQTIKLFETVATLTAANVSLRDEVSRLVDEGRGLREEVARLTSRIEELEAEVVALRAQLTPEQVEAAKAQVPTRRRRAAAVPDSAAA